ncbi:MAG: dienelactone hydrolase family protein [Balneolaceae bacterium]|nr:dienelactone hydrolase family protein [Balneolaceae bacterium]MBO6545318.1 dienelactone hydrolase family protein [Balneolaceae bacterium]MBO6646714.1 dienelactone hydrolase family protein [Balneolaceae bacterium]
MSDFNNPHQNQPVAVTGKDINEAKFAMIMIHGRGASAQSIIGLSNEFENTDDFIFLAPQASDHTWYPYSFLAPRDQNQPGINSGLKAISDIIKKLNAQGIANDHIFLLGFSQGACLASEYAVRNPDKYAGVIALSGGVIGDSINPSEYVGDLKETPMFMGCSDVDAHIPVQRLDETQKVFEKLGAKVQKKIYPGMGHLVNEDEIRNINTLIEQSLR